VLGVVEPVRDEKSAPSFVGDQVIFSFLVMASLIVRSPAIFGLLEKNGSLLLEALGEL
jgi:hypothetical protein